MKRRILTLFAAALSVLQVSCTKDSGLLAVDSEGEDYVSVSLDVDTGCIAPLTRSLITTPDNATPSQVSIKNVRFGIYLDGALVGDQYVTGKTGTQVQLRKGATYTVFTLVNCGECMTFPQSIADVSSMYYSLSDMSDVNTLGFPFAGPKDGTTFTAGNNPGISVAVRNMMAKINVRVDRSRISDHDGSLGVLSLKLVNAPKGCSPFNDSRALRTQDVFQGDQATSGDRSILNGSGVASFYVFENMQGDLVDKSNTDPWAKIPSKDSEKAVSTYLEMTGAYSADRGRLSATNTYRMYLGRDNVHNFDVQRNTVSTIVIQPTHDGWQKGSWKVISNVDTDNRSLYFDPSEVTLEYNVPQDADIVRSPGNMECSYTVSDEIRDIVDYDISTGAINLKAQLDEDVTGKITAVSWDGRLTAELDVTALQYCKYEYYDIEIIIDPLASIPASGGTSMVPSYTYRQRVHPSVGEDFYITPDNVTEVDIRYGTTATPTSTDPSACRITVGSLGTTVKEQTAVGKAYIKVSMNGKTATQYVDVYQAENRLLDQHYKDKSGTVGDNVESNATLKSRGTPTISIGDGLTAAGGSAQITASVKDTYSGSKITSWYQRYSSGSWSDLKSESTPSGDFEQDGEVTLSITTNGNSRFHLSGTTLSHDSMGANVTTDNVTVKAVNKNSTDKAASDSKSITNALLDQHYKDKNGTVGDNSSGSSSVKSYGTPTISIADGITAAGGSSPITASVKDVYTGSTTLTWYQKYTSGTWTDLKSSSTPSGDYEQDGEVTLSITDNGNDRFSLDGSTLKHSSMTTNITTDNVTVRATNKNSTGKYASASKSVSNALLDQHYKDKNGTVGDNVDGSTTLKSRGTPVITIGDGLTAGGGSAPISASVVDIYTGTATTSWYQKYTSGSWTDLKSSSQSGDVEQQGEVTLSITSNGNSRFHLSGTTLSHDSMTTNETTDKVTVRAVNKNSTGKYKDASVSVVNTRHHGEETASHSRHGSETTGSKSYGGYSYGSKVYGTRYSEDVVGTEVYDGESKGNESRSYSNYKFMYSISNFSVSPSVINFDAEFHGTSDGYSYSLSCTKSDYNWYSWPVYHNYHTPGTRYWYKPYTQSWSRSWSQEHRQACTITYSWTDTFDSGSTLGGSRTEEHTEIWNVTGTDYGEDEGRESDGSQDITTSRKEQVRTDGEYRFISSSPVSLSTSYIDYSCSADWVTIYKSSCGYLIQRNDGDARSTTVTFTYSIGEGDGKATATATLTINQAGSGGGSWDIDVD